MIAFAAQAAPKAAHKPAPAMADRYATNNGVKIHYVVEGKGPLVVLIHGFPDYWATWKPLMATLSAAGYRTAALDTRGYNLSDKPQGVAAYAMPNLIGDVAAVIAAEGQKDAVVIGHDWGAAILDVAFTRPELDNLIVLSTPHPRSGLQQGPAGPQPVRPQLPEGGLEGLSAEEPGRSGGRTRTNGRPRSNPSPTSGR
jgi:pimeloyl-ACP methyl ester carboxylesterase